MTDWFSVDGARIGHDLQREQLDALQEPDETSRRVLPCEVCERLRYLDPALGVCPDCFAEGGEVGR